LLPDTRNPQASLHCRVAIALAQLCARAAAAVREAMVPYEAREMEKVVSTEALGRFIDGAEALEKRPPEQLQQLAMPILGNHWHARAPARWARC
jgi:hypothetical protein